MDWLVALLTWLSADPAVVDRAAPRAAAAVDVAYATLAREPKKGNDQATQPAAGGKCPTGTCPPSSRPR